MPGATRADVTALFTTYIEPQATPFLMNDLTFYRFGIGKEIPEMSGDTYQVQFPATLTPTTVPTAEMATGNSNQLSWTTATMQVQFYANDIVFSQLVQGISETNYRDSAFGVLAYNAAQVANRIVRDSLDTITTTQIMNNKTVATLVAADTLNVTEINEATTGLNNIGVRTHPQTPGAFPLLLHTQVAGDLRADTGAGSNPNALTWYDTARRNDVAMIENSRCGRTMKAEIFETQENSRFTTGGASGAVIYYNNYLLGDHLLMVGKIRGLSAPTGGQQEERSLVHLIPPEFSHATRYGNVYAISWAHYCGSGIIQGTRGTLMQVAAAA